MHVGTSGIQQHSAGAFFPMLIFTQGQSEVGFNPLTGERTQRFHWHDDASFAAACKSVRDIQTQWLIAAGMLPEPVVDPIEQLADQLFNQRRAA